MKESVILVDIKLTSFCVRIKLESDISVHCSFVEISLSLSLYNLCIVYFYMPKLLCPDRLWGLPSLLYNGSRRVLSPGAKSCRGVTLTTYPI
jgi:hypothetical protein